MDRQEALNKRTDILARYDAGLETIAANADLSTSVKKDEADTIYQVATREMREIRREVSRPSKERTSDMNAAIREAAGGESPSRVASRALSDAATFRVPTPTEKGLK